MSRRALWNALKLAVLIVLVVGTTLIARSTPVGESLEHAGRRLLGLREHSWAVVFYGAFYAAAVGLGFPGSPLTLLGGTAFGLWPGVVVNLAGALAGAALAFWEARFLGYEVVRKVFGKRLAHLNGLERPRAAFFAFARLRLIPLVPFNGINFAAGLTRAPFSAYLAGTAVGILPSTCLWTYFAEEIVHGEVGVREAALVRLLVALAALLLLSFLPGAAGALRRRR